MTLVNPAVLYFDGYLTVAANFTFVPPKAAAIGRGRAREEDASSAAAAADEAAAGALVNVADAPPPPPPAPAPHVWLAGEDDDGGAAPQEELNADALMALELLQRGWQGGGGRRRIGMLPRKAPLTA